MPETRPGLPHPASAPGGDAPRGLAVEVMAVAGLLSLVAAVVFGPHVAQGGFYSDDWSTAATYHYADSPKVLWMAERFVAGLGSRFVAAALHPVPHALFGLDTAPHLALAVGQGVLAAACFYLFLRTVGLERLHAAILALLALLFPWSDSLRLWSIAGVNNLAASLYFLGTVVAVRGLTASGRRAALVHSVALLLYTLAVFTYEAPLPLILLSILTYAHRAPSLGVALSRWRADLVLGLVLLIAVAVLTARPAPSTGWLVKSPARFLGEGVSLLGHSVLPLGLPALASALAVIGLVLLLARGWSRASGERRRDPELRRWLGVALTALVLTGAAHVMFVGTGLFPLAPGTENRGNVLAAYGYVTVAYSLVMAGGLIFAPATTSRRGLRVLALSAVAVLGTCYVVKVARDADRWDRAASAQERVLAAVKALVPDPPPGSTLYVVGAAGRVAPGIPIFSETWDLNGAVRLALHDNSLKAHPIYGETRFVCERRGMYPLWRPERHGPGGGIGRDQGARYGRGILVDVGARRLAVVRDAAHCRALRQRFRPGPIFAS